MTKFIKMVLCSLIVLFAIPVEAHKERKHHHKMEKIEVDGLIISHVWARAGKPNSAVYMTIINTTDQDRKIVSASAEGVAKKVELHDHLWDNGVMKMRNVDLVDLPAGHKTRLRPGEKHIMLMDMEKSLEKGQVLDIKLKLDNGKLIDLKVPVKSLKHRGSKGSRKKSKDCGGCEKAKGKPCPCPKGKNGSTETTPEETTPVETTPAETTPKEEPKN